MFSPCIQIRKKTASLSYRDSVYLIETQLCFVFLFAPTVNLRPGAEQKVVFITARVHPGETPSSFVCQGQFEMKPGNGDFFFSLCFDLSLAFITYHSIVQNQTISPSWLVLSIQTVRLSTFSRRSLSHEWGKIVCFAIPF